jgi:hypothetical protein
MMAFSCPHCPHSGPDNLHRTYRIDAAGPDPAVAHLLTNAQTSKKTSNMNDIGVGGENHNEKLFWLKSIYAIPTTRGEKTTATVSNDPNKNKNIENGLLRL